jgi:chromosome segregation ATPase
MAELTLEMLREELAPIRAGLTALHGLQGSFAAIERTVAALQGNVAAQQGNLAALERNVAVLQGNFAALQGNLAALERNVAVLQADVAAMRPNVDGIPLIQRAVSVLQEDMRTLRDDMTVVSTTTMRLDRTRDHHEGVLTDILREMRAVHAQIAGIASRVRKLEGVE